MEEQYNVARQRASLLRYGAFGLCGAAALLLLLYPRLWAGLFDTDYFMPHGECYLWKPSLILLHGISDLLIGLAYATIPVTLIYFVRKRKDLPFHWMFVAFGVFIVACGATHFMEIWTLRYPYYWLSGVIKAITAAAFVPTAILLIRLVPKALLIPSRADLERAQEELRMAHADLERRVEQRTAELKEANERLQTEIRERKHAEAEALKKSALIDMSLDAIIMRDIEGEIIFWSKGAERLYGWTYKEARGRNLHELLQTEFPQPLDEIKNELLRNESWEGELTHTTKDGRRVVALSRWQLQLAAEGAAQEILETNTEITERKRAEETRARLAAIVESSDDAIISKDLNSIIKSWNAGAQRLFGYTEEEVIGKPITIIIPPELLYEESLIISRLRAGESIEHYETERVTKNGRRVLVSLVISPIRDASGRVIGASKIVRDITKRRRTEAEREKLLQSERRARREAEEASRLKDEFLATISHELRTPLTSILGWSSLMNSGALNERRLAQGIETIERNARAQAQLIDELLDVSRIVTGKMQISSRPLDLLAVIESALESIRPAAEAKRLRVSVETEAGAGAMAGDSDRLQQVFWNLLSNAVKFTDENGLIEIKLARSDGRVRVTVSDTGEGIAPEFLPFVFDRFRQADGTITRRHGGLGLGLSIVRHIVELHGGTVEAKSEGEGKGATFVLTFPAHDVRSEKNGTDGANDSENLSQAV